MDGLDMTRQEQDEAERAEEGDDTTLAKGRVGCCFFDPLTDKLSFLEDQQDSTGWDLTHLGAPALVLVVEGRRASRGPPNPRCALAVLSRLCSSQPCVRCLPCDPARCPLPAALAVQAVLPPSRQVCRPSCFSCAFVARGKVEQTGRRKLLHSGDPRGSGVQVPSDESSVNHPRRGLWHPLVLALLRDRSRPSAL